MADQEDTANHHTHDEEALLKTWRTLCKRFSGVRYVANRASDTWPLFQRNYVGDVTISWKLTYWRKAKALLVPLQDPEIDYLRTLAQQRLEFAASLFRAWAVASITLPASALVIANQLFPVWVKEELLSNNFSFTSGFTLGLGSFVVINLAYVYLNVFKAREMRMALEMEAASRRLKRGETIASAGGDATDLSL